MNEFKHDESLDRGAQSQRDKQLKEEEYIRSLIIEADLTPEETDKLRAMSASYVTLTAVLAEDDYAQRDSCLTAHAKQFGVPEFVDGSTDVGAELSCGISDYGILAVHLGRTPLTRSHFEQAYKFIPHPYQSLDVPSEVEAEGQNMSIARTAPVFQPAYEKPSSITEELLLILDSARQLGRVAVDLVRSR